MGKIRHHSDKLEHSMDKARERSLPDAEIGSEPIRKTRNQDDLIIARRKKLRSDDPLKFKEGSPTGSETGRSETSGRGAAGRGTAGRGAAGRTGADARKTDTARAVSRRPAKNTGKASAVAVSKPVRHALSAADQDDNSGGRSVQLAEEAAENSAHAGNRYRRHRKVKQGLRSAKISSSTAANAAAAGDPVYSTTAAEAAAGSNPASRRMQRKMIQREYAAAGSGAGGSNFGMRFASWYAARREAGKMRRAARRSAKKTAGRAAGNPFTWILLSAAVLILIIISAFASCSMLASGITGMVADTSYSAEDADILGAEEDYIALENALQEKVDNIEVLYPDFDEYSLSVAEIGHDPYELAALLTVLYEDYSREDVQETLQEIFDLQYSFELEELAEVTAELQTVAETSEDGSSESTEEIEVSVSILSVSLTNGGISAAAEALGLSEDDLDRYYVMAELFGNREDLFADVSYITSAGEYTDYDIPGEALSDEKFANMIEEAEKYLGMAYVYGGSSPSTGFDCSGFVCWVINHCGNGWSVGRTDCNGLMDYCDIISSGEAQPGDLIFFQGTYSKSGATHVGIYVGDGMMIHCGDPISYTSIETSYWQEHFYCFGRIKDD